MITESSSPGWGFYLLWVVCNSAIIVLSEIIGFFLIGGIASAVAWDSPGALLVAVQFAFVASAFLGVGQWLIMSRYLSQIGIWPVLTIVGYCISVPALFYLFAHEVGGSFSVERLIVTAIILVGSSVGLCQWLAIRHLHNSGWWIIIVILDVALSLLIGQLTNVTIPSIGFGFLTGWGVIWLSQEQPDSLPTIHDKF